MTKTIRRPTRKKQTVTLGVPPSANRRLLFATHRGTGKTRFFKTDVARRYKKIHATMLAFLTPVPSPRDVKLDVVWHMKPGDGGDIDNILKLLLDALVGHGFDDDKQVAELTVSRVREQRQSQLVVTVEDLTPMYQDPA